ncbi:uncharacterized protein EV420DRAFT_1545939 [Desarmillaria tabescens]|uniref:Uncharacterized protein n=1 Tax=Armillaria tabescens TaxID=1929756 RepID=A0AA39KDM1_ARMTA|nr:uncharacterized protein EV420DRAFT_1545939 [Desarmillaria tabescens]KAK0458010.1 hypothetical protein EV420DRAFT_1545939 [Desarmillaria tabescens]
MGLWCVLFIFYTNAFVLGLFGVSGGFKRPTTSSPIPRISPYVRQHVLRIPLRRQIWPLHIPLLRPPSPWNCPITALNGMHIDLNHRRACNLGMWGT